MNPHAAALPHEIVERLVYRRDRYVARGGKPARIIEAESGVVALAMEIVAYARPVRSQHPTPTGTMVRRILVEALRVELTAAELPWEELSLIRRAEEIEASTG